MRTSSRSFRILSIAALLAVVALALPAIAVAHSFLIRSDPAAGARLTKSPPLVSMYFSEPFVGGSEHVSITRSGGGALAVSAPQVRASGIRQPLPARLSGVYVVTWRVLSDDGHISLGEFAFAVGSTAALPSLGAGSSASTPISEVAASWLFFIGLALALGGIVSERLFRRQSDAFAGAGRMPALVGVVLAVFGQLWTLVLLAGARAGGGFTVGLSGHALRQVIATRPGELTLGVLIALAASLVGASLRLPLRLLAVVPLVAAVVEVSARGHSGTSGDWWALAADIVHLLGAALWVGALALLVLVAARTRDHVAALVAGVRSYSRLALPTVLIVLASGVVTAIPQFQSVSEVVSTGYGRALLIKAGLISAALLLALVSRLRALGANPTPRLGLLRRTTGAEMFALVGVLVAVSVLVNSAPPRTEAGALALPHLGAAPLQGPAVQLADLAGQLVVGVAATERELRFTVLPPGSAPAGVLKLTADANPPSGKPHDLFPRACGVGCFTIRYRLRPGMTRVNAHVSSSLWKGCSAHFRLSAPIPAEASTLLARVAQTIRRLPSLSLTEQVSSGPGAHAAPAAYTLSGKQFMESEVFGGGGVDVREIARTGRLRQIAFAVPGSNIWYRFWIDAQNRLKHELIVTPGHRIVRTFSYHASGAAPKQRSTPYGVSAVPGSPRPPDAPLVLAQEAGDLAVGLALRPAGGRLLLTATVIGGDGLGAAGVGVRFVVATAAGARSVRAANCGDGCHRAQVALRSRPRTIEVDLDEPGQATKRLHFTLPAEWPPPKATALARHATQVFRHLQTLVIHERLASSPANFVVTTWRLQAPDRLSYVIRGGSQAVLVGTKRWDRASAGARWQQSSSTDLPQPTPPWIMAPAHAALLGSSTVRGHAVWIVSFLEPSTPAWFKLAIDKKTMRTLELRMVAPAHFMHQRYSGFNNGFTIRLPPGADSGGDVNYCLVGAGQLLLGSMPPRV
jgi:copper transport protein